MWFASFLLKIEMLAIQSHSTQTVIRRVSAAIKNEASYFQAIRKVPSKKETHLIYEISNLENGNFKARSMRTKQSGIDMLRTCVCLIV